MIQSPTHTIKKMEKDIALNKPQPEQVAAVFVREYYNFMISKPEELHKFYKDESTMTYGCEKETKVTKGLADITQRIQDLDYLGSKVRLSSVDAQPSLENSILICVHGELRKRDAGFQEFSQTFILAEQSISGYFVKNDVFRFLDFPRPESDEKGYHTLKSETELRALPPVAPSITHRKEIPLPIEQSKASDAESDSNVEEESKMQVPEKKSETVEEEQDKGYEEDLEEEEDLEPEASEKKDSEEDRKQEQKNVEQQPADSQILAPKESVAPQQKKKEPYNKRNERKPDFTQRTKESSEESWASVGLQFFFFTLLKL